MAASSESAPQHLALVVDRPPQVAHLAIDLHVHLVETPPPMGMLAHRLDTLVADFAGGPKRFHRSRTVSWQMSMPRSNSRSSTLRSDSGCRTYISTTSRITSGEESNQRNGLSGLAMAVGYRREFTVPQV